MQILKNIFGEDIWSQVIVIATQADKGVFQKTTKKETDDQLTKIMTLTKNNYGCKFLCWCNNPQILSGISGNFASEETLQFKRFVF